MGKIEEALNMKPGASLEGLKKPPITPAGKAAIKLLVDSQKTVPTIDEKIKASL
jgi:hypothetical protein